MSAEKTVKKVNKILNNVTPLRYDCGTLCDCECCKGDVDTGMILFPGEENQFKNNKDFIVKETSDGKHVLICKGSCDRNLRPISCRIFPLFPMLIDGKIYVIDDPRANGICPLVYDRIKLRKSFVKKVGRVGRLLAENEETCKVLEKLSDEISDIFTLRKAIFGGKED